MKKYCAAAGRRSPFPASPLADTTALLVYAVPIVLFLIGYFASYALTSEGLRYAIAIAAFCLGIVPAILYDRKLKREGGLAFTIIRTL